MGIGGWFSFPNSDQPGRAFRVDLGLGRGNGVDMRKRIIDLIEKMAAGCFIGAIIQGKGYPLGWAFPLAILCLFLQWRADK